MGVVWGTGRLRPFRRNLKVSEPATENVSGSENIVCFTTTICRGSGKSLVCSKSSKDVDETTEVPRDRQGPGQTGCSGLCKVYTLPADHPVQCYLTATFQGMLRC